MSIGPFIHDESQVIRTCAERDQLQVPQRLQGAAMLIRAKAWLFLRTATAHPGWLLFYYNSVRLPLLTIFTRTNSLPQLSDSTSTPFYPLLRASLQLLSIRSVKKVLSLNGGFTPLNGCEGVIIIINASPFQRLMQNLMTSPTTRTFSEFPIRPYCWRFVKVPGILNSDGKQNILSSSFPLR